MFLTSRDLLISMRFPGSVLMGDVVGIRQASSESVSNEPATFRQLLRLLE